VDYKRVRSGRMASATAYLPAAVALGIILLAGLYADRQSRVVAVLDQRAEVQARLESLAGALATHVEAVVSTADRLAGALAVRPVADAATLAPLVAEFHPALRLLAAVVPVSGPPLVLAGDAQVLRAVLADPR